MFEPQYKIGRGLGNGGFGVVYEAKMTVTRYDESNVNNQNPESEDAPVATTQLVAIKEIPPKKVDLESKRLVREVDILGMLSVSPCHPCVLRLLDAYVNMQGPDGFSVNLVMPLYSGDLHQFAKEIHRAAHTERNIQNYLSNPQLQQSHPQGPPTVPPGYGLKYVSEVARVLAFRTICGLAYIHSCHLVHRDMKPENVMITVDRLNPVNSHAVVGDFGLARAVSPTETFYTCTRQYRPPEVVTNTAKGNSSMDIWSTGCVLFELVTGVHLFQVPSARDRENNWVPALASQQLEAMLDVFGTPSAQDIQHIAGTNVQTYLQKTRARPSEVRGRFEREFKLICSPEDRENWFNLVNSCLQFVPDRRLTAEQLIKHDLFTSAGLFCVGPNEPPLTDAVRQSARLVIDAPAPRVYRGGATRDDIRSNKETILALVRRIHEHMFPPYVPGSQTDDAAKNQQQQQQQIQGQGQGQQQQQNGNNNNNNSNNNNNNVFPNPQTNRVGQWFGNVEAVLSDPEGALDGALEAMRMTDDLTDEERIDLENIANFCRTRLEVQQD